MISMNAEKGDLSPKNRIDQSTFKTSWKAKNKSAILVLLSSRPALQIRKREIPIKRNKVIQTGENTQLGGLKDGFSRAAYQVGIAGEVNNDPIKPAA